MLLKNAQKPSTQKSYSAAIGMYKKFWLATAQAGNLFPSSSKSLLYFSAWLSKRGILKQTIQQYLSAIRNEDARLGFGDQSKQLDMLLRGVDNVRTAERGPRQAKPAWEASWVIQAQDMLMHRLQSGSSQLRDVQALATVVFGFLFAQRASSTVAIRRQDVQCTSAYLQVSEGLRKTKKERIVHTFKVPTQQCSLAKAIMAYTLFMKRRYAHIDEHYLLSEWFKQGNPSASVNTALQRARELLGLPSVNTQQSHALRRGAAATMFALGVPMQRILSWGGWESEKSMRPYIKDRVWTTLSADHGRCFSWMLQSVSGSQDMGLEGTGVAVVGRRRSLASRQS